MKILNAQIREIQSGKNVKIMMPCNLYECILEDDVFVGPFVEIQSQVRIGKKTRIQSHSFICSLVEIGQECFIGHGVMFINDLFSQGHPSIDKEKWKSTKIGNRVSIGSNATILPVNICDGVVIGAGSVVTSDIKERGIYAGNPARKIRTLQEESQTRITERKITKTKKTKDRKS